MFSVTSIKRQPPVSQNDVITFMTSYLKGRFKNGGCLPSSNLKDDLGLDSLDIAEMILALEEKYGVEFVGDEMPRIETVENLAGHTNFLIEKKNG
ncbi:MAG: hypothetical protein A2048_06205 [Deltaproteobacteria bacterium GWA2_45_12]|nr:MAG: hypothetical protein A2048_06205 [Deltaproteobacteria bacterium GWA2_45_12]